MIKPTVGRVVWYYPTAGDEPRAATIAHVHSDTLINIGFLHTDGSHCSQIDVPLLQDGPLGDQGSVIGGFCKWMPYQIEQAKQNTPAEPVKPPVAEPTVAPTPSVTETPA